MGIVGGQDRHHGEIKGNRSGRMATGEAVSLHHQELFGRPGTVKQGFEHQIHDRQNASGGQHQQAEVAPPAIQGQIGQGGRHEQARKADTAE